ncbi:NTP transferase domain-containing protein [Pontibacter anaerobius]|uniref:Probable molybdenum cofactor guanylyltransferase n=1 Tax=Pontibacter anaerobius TaxID=2993940 RepID=A0ABT3RGJ7_9BACT|nr:NTP transferase domain-containing protein [Pontibacter anaerobius]MCX2740951.1 NTP transferase domain-containing protein [Pontibacter anaerobius]
MTLKDHKKHSLITRPSFGNFGRNEWAILGTPCGTIKALADTVIQALAPKYKCAYVDASHAHADGETTLPGRLASGAEMEYTDQIHYHQFDLNRELNQFQFRQLFQEADVVLVNGNHQQARAQVVVIDNAKKASLQKRLSQLDNVALFILADDAEEVFDFVQKAIPAWQAIPTCRLSDTDKIITFFREQMQRAKPKLNGLVLAGGQSIRMGQDKGAMNWHGKEQRYYAADLLKEVCEEVFISCRPEQQAEIDSTYTALPDTFTGLGPYGAILSAFREQPDAAWLVVACDMPLLDSATLQHLVKNRNSSSVATTYVSPHDGFPEPLITIWEPKSYPVLLAFLAQGYTCPRKVLRNSVISLLEPLQAEALLNANTPEDSEKVKEILQQKTTS